MKRPMHVAAETGHGELLKHLVDKYKADPNSKDIVSHDMTHFIKMIYILFEFFIASKFTNALCNRNESFGCREILNHTQVHYHAGESGKSLDDSLSSLFHRK